MDCSKRSALAGLPDDAMVEILARVPVRSVHRSKCVAKAWRDIIDDPLHRKKLPQTLEGFFVFTDGCGGMEIFGFINVMTRSVPLNIDPYFSFLKNLPEIRSLYLWDSCNGLLLFEHRQELESFDVPEFIVCNPATEQWVNIPTCHRCPSSADYVIFLVFDPAVSSHFHVIQFWEEDRDDEAGALGDDFVISVHAYSSEAGMWNHNQTDWDEQGQLEGWRHKDRYSRTHAFVKGMVHLIVMNWVPHNIAYIVALDVQGKTQRMITLPPRADGTHKLPPDYIGQSQGRLHYIHQDIVARDSGRSYDLCIWVLQDYDTQEWVLKDTVCMVSEFRVVAIHQDCNVVFLLQPLNRLIAYDMDRKEVSVVATFKKERWGWRLLPYIPYFSESPTFTNKH